MPKKTILGFILFIILLSLPILACGLSLPKPQAEVDKLATAQAGVQQAGEAIETAAAVAPSQGAAAMATMQAIDAPELDALRDKLASIEPDQFGNYTVTLTDAEINQVLRAGGRLTDPNNQVQLDNTVVSFNNGTVYAQARLVVPLGADIQIAMQPRVQDGQLWLELTSASVGPLPAPGFVLSGIETALNNAIGASFNNAPDNVQLISVTVGQGALTVVGRAS